MSGANHSGTPNFYPQIAFFVFSHFLYLSRKTILNPFSFNPLTLALPAIALLLLMLYLTLLSFKN